MYGWSRIVTLVAVAAVVAIATGGAGATSKPTRAPAASAGKVSTAAARRGALLRTANLSTRAGAVRYLRAIGVDPRGVVIQRGLRNYAGASCPGAGWTCSSTAHPVVQIAAAGGVNRFLCGSASCAVVQATTAASAASRPPTTNKATCVKTTGPTQDCVIDQTSLTANNVAIVIETSKISGLTQTGSYTAEITQTANGASNTNTACVLQNINLDGSTTAKKAVPVNVTLNAQQSVSITQDSAAGGNTVQGARLTDDCGATNSALTQSQTLTSSATGSGPITQNENAGATAANVSLDIEQNQGSGFFGSASGANSAAFSQTSNLSAVASTPTGPVNQTQSSTPGGILAKVNQYSTDISTANATQTETQCEHAQSAGVASGSCSTGSPLSYVVQKQFGPIGNAGGGSRSAGSRSLAGVKKGDCPPDCSTQAGNSNDTFTIIQSSTLNNDNGTNSEQTNTVQADCTTSGNCSATQTTSENGSTTTHTATGSTVNTSTNCTEGSGCTTSTSSGFVSGDVLVSVGDGLVQERSPSGALVRTLNTGKGSGFFTTGLAFNAGRLYVTDFNANDVTKILSDGSVAGSFGSGYSSDPESIVFDTAGNAYVGQADDSKQVLKFSPTGTLVASFSPVPENRGTDWIDLAPDGLTLYYTSEGTSVKRFDVSGAGQQADFVTGLAAPAFAVKVLSTNDVLVADTTSIILFDPNGNILHTYGADVNAHWFSLALDPSGTSFWAGDLASGVVTRFDLNTTGVLASFNTESTVISGKADGLAVAP